MCVARITVGLRFNEILIAHVSCERAYDGLLLQMLAIITLSCSCIMYSPMSLCELNNNNNPRHHTFYNVLHIL